MARLRSAGRCTDLERRRVLVRYGLHLATESEEREVEPHLLGCDTCFENVATLWRASELVEECHLDLADSSLRRPRRDAACARRRLEAVLIWLASLTALMLGIALACRP